MESVISDYVKRLFKDNSDILEHTTRVVNYSKQIADTQKIDSDCLVMAAWLHDICRSDLECGLDDTQSEPISSQFIAEKILQKINLSDKVIDTVSSIILAQEQLPQNPSIEMRILFESDNLDNIGAVGISRLFSEVGSKKALTIINQNILPNMENWFITQKGIELAKDKINFLNLFVDNYNAETINSKMR